jgi:hypothetical protein
VSRDTYVGHVEPHLAIDPTDPSRLLAAAQLVPRSHPSGDRRQLGTYLSLDGGKSWRSNGALPGSSDTRLGLDTTVGFDRDGTAYVLGEEQHGGVAPIMLWRSRDGGRRFDRPVQVAAGRDCCDHGWLAIDTTTGPRAGTLYAAYANKTGIAVRASRDKGSIWSAARRINVPRRLANGFPVIGATAVVDDQGALHVAMLAGTKSNVVIATSTDGASTFRLSLGPGDARALPQIASDNTSIYVTYPTVQGGIATPVVATYNRARATWSQPVTIRSPAAGTSNPQPSIVASAGTVYVTFFAFPPTSLDVYLATSRDHGKTFTSPQLISRAPHPRTNGIAGKTDPGFLGDYQALALAPDRIHPLWNDPRTGALQLYTASLPTG